MVNASEKVGRIGQNSFRSGVGLVNVSEKVGQIGQNSSEAGWDWRTFLRKWVGIGQTF